MEVQVTVRLRDVAATVKDGDFAVLILYLGFEEQSTVELVATLAGEPRARPPAIVCLAPPEAKGALARKGELEAQLRAAGAAEFIHLAKYPRTPQGNDVLRKRILSAATQQLRATPVVRVLHRAAQIAGGSARLARHLDVPELNLLRWMRGEEEAPEAVFLAAFEVVLSDLERGVRKPS